MACIQFYTFFARVFSKQRSVLKYIVSDPILQVLSSPFTYGVCAARIRLVRSLISTLFYSADELQLGPRI